jgi:hypothetical protein
MSSREIDGTLPDPLDAVCGWCRREVAFHKMHPTHVVSRRDSGPRGRQTIRVVSEYLCPRGQCNRPSLAFFDVTHDPVYDEDFIFDDLIGLLPAGRAAEMRGLPPEIERDRDEAWSSFYGGNLRAAIIMGRAAIQRAVRVLDANGAGLKQEINDLVQQRKITESLGRFAHEARIAGDDAAHPEELGEVTRAEAESSLSFVDEFLRVAIVMPALAEERRLTRKPAAS